MSRPFDRDAMRATVKLLKAFTDYWDAEEDSVPTFWDLVNYVVEMKGVKAAREQAFYLELAWTLLRKRAAFIHLEPAGKVSDILKDAPEEETPRMHDDRTTQEIMEELCPKNPTSPDQLAPISVVVLETWKRSRPNAVRVMERDGNY